MNLKVAFKPAYHDIGDQSRPGPTECTAVVTCVAFHSDLSVDLKCHGLATTANTRADKLGQVLRTGHVVTPLVQRSSWLKSPASAAAGSMTSLDQIVQHGRLAIPAPAI